MHWAMTKLCLVPVYFPSEPVHTPGTLLQMSSLLLSANVCLSSSLKPPLITTWQEVYYDQEGVFSQSEAYPVHTAVLSPGISPNVGNRIA